MDCLILKEDSFFMLDKMLVYMPQKGQFLSVRI